MCMANQEMDSVRARTSQHVQPQHSYTGAAVQHQIGAVLGTDLYAGSVAAVDSCAMSRCWNRSASSPKAYMHQTTFSPLSGHFSRPCRKAMFSMVHRPVKRILRVGRPGYILNSS